MTSAPRPSELERLIRALAIDSANVRLRAAGYETHAARRMAERGIDDLMVFDVLRTGHLRGEIVPGNGADEWKAKMCKAMRGGRTMGVVTLVVRAEKLFVKTVEWEDPV